MSSNHRATTSMVVADIAIPSSSSSSSSPAASSSKILLSQQRQQQRENWQTKGAPTATTTTTSTNNSCSSSNNNNNSGIVSSVDGDDDDDSCEFHDACSEQAIPCTMDLDTALDEAQLAIHYFFNNKFDDARNLMKPWSHSSMYHSLGTSVFAFLEAILTFEHQHIAAAGDELRNSLEVCDKHRKKNSIGETIGRKFKRNNYDHYTEMETHAELCSAEVLLLKAMLTFIEDETLSSLIRGGMKIRHCFNTYKECATIFTQRKWRSANSKIHFESGVRMGMGTFNLMISLLPSYVIRVLEFIGFSGNKKSGIADLNAGYRLPGLRQVLCAMTLLGYHLVVCYVLSHQEGDLVLCDEILTKQLQQYPDGVWFLFFKGRLEFMKGNLDEAQFWYKKSWKSQDVWPQFHHLSFWELLWVNCLKLDWREASLYASNLLENSKWSRTIYSYQKAVVMLAIGDENLTQNERQQINNLIRDAPKYKQRIAGKSLPMEKFICKKAERYFAQKCSLCLPAIELMYVWNTFKVMGKHFHIADGIYQIIERTMKQYAERKRYPAAEPFDVDNRALMLLLKGACLRHTKNPMLALRCLESVVALQNQIKEDTYLVPYAAVEIALIHAEEGRRNVAIAVLEDVKKRYSRYSLESRLHFRIHAALTELKSDGF